MPLPQTSNRNYGNLMFSKKLPDGSTKMAELLPTRLKAKLEEHGKNWGLRSKSYRDLLERENFWLAKNKKAGKIPAFKISQFSKDYVHIKNFSLSMYLSPFWSIKPSIRRTQKSTNGTIPKIPQTVNV